MIAESTAGIIPGDRGKGDGSWCRLPLQTALAVGQAYLTSSSGRSRVRSGKSRISELSGEARLETAREPSQAHGPFRSVRLRSYPEGFGCYCADQNAVARPGGPTPPKGPARSHEQGA